MIVFERADLGQLPDTTALIASVVVQAERISRAASQLCQDRARGVPDSQAMPKIARTFFPPLTSVEIDRVVSEADKVCKVVATLPPAAFPKPAEAATLPPAAFPKPAEAATLPPADDGSKKFKIAIGIGLGVLGLGLLIALLRK